MYRWLLSYCSHTEMQIFMWCNIYNYVCTDYIKCNNFELGLSKMNYQNCSLFSLNYDFCTYLVQRYTWNIVGHKFLTREILANRHCKKFD